MCDTLLEALIILKCNAIICKHEWRRAPRSAVDDADVWDADVVLSAPRLRKSRKKVAAAITTSATASSAISLLYLHIINIPMHVICRASTYDDGRRWTTRRPSSSVVAQLCRQVDVRRRAVCERALRPKFKPSSKIRSKTSLKNETFFAF